MDEKELAIRIDKIWGHALNARNSAQSAMEGMEELRQRMRDEALAVLEAKLRHHKGRAA